MKSLNKKDKKEFFKISIFINKKFTLKKVKIISIIYENKNLV